MPDAAATLHIPVELFKTVRFRSGTFSVTLELRRVFHVASWRGPWLELEDGISRTR